MQTEIEDMIWEVDEDCDQGLNWAEFQAMYHRCNNDKTGEKTVLPIDFLAHIVISQFVGILLQDMSLDGSSM